MYIEKLIKTSLYRIGMQCTSASWPTKSASWARSSSRAAALQSGCFKKHRFANWSVFITFFPRYFPSFSRFYFFLNGASWLKDLVIFEVGFGFLMQNSIYGQMETLGIHQLGLRTEKTYFENVSNTKNWFFGLQRGPRRSQEGLKSSGGPVRIICT